MLICMHVDCLLVLIKHLFCITIFYVPNSAQFLKLTSNLVTVNRQQIIEAKVIVTGLLIVRIGR